VPITPAKTLAAGLIAVSLIPIGMLILGRGPWDFGATINVLLMHYPDYLMVGLAVFVSHVVTEFGQHVARAREMGAYQRGELLGRGGMGEVYYARHRMLARPAAIKLIRPELLAAANGAAAQLAVKRFEQEARVAASLRSPHTVALYDFGVLEDESLYFVMELLEGMTLDALVGR
jgi:serine/threonine-protein kinase